MAHNNRTREGQATSALGADEMAIDIEQYDGICVLRCKGRLVAGLDGDYIQSKIFDLQRLNCKRVLADFREVASIGSTGLALIVGVYESVVKQRGGSFVVAGARPLVQHVLEITKLSTLIASAADLASGLAALGFGARLSSREVADAVLCVTSAPRR